MSTKKTKLVLANGAVVIAIAMAMAGGVTAGETATANAYVNVITPISISKDTTVENSGNMSFGVIAKTGALLSGTLELKPSGVVIATTLVQVSSTKVGTRSSPAAFKVVGDSTSTFSFAIAYAPGLSSCAALETFSAAYRGGVDLGGTSPNFTGALTGESANVDVGATARLINCSAPTAKLDLGVITATVAYN